MLSSSFRLLLEVFFSRPFWKISIILSSLLAAVFGLLAPFLQKEFIDLLTGTPAQMKIEWIETWLMSVGFSSNSLAYLFLSFISLFLSLAFNTLTTYLGNREAILLQRVLAQRLYDHSLRIRTDSLMGKPVGETVSIYATDVYGATVFLEQTLPTGFSILFPFVLVPWALVTYFSIPLWPITSMMGLVIFVSFVMAFRQAKYFFQFKKLAADRIGLVNEWIQNIRTLRILGWLQAYEQKIFKVRRVETVNRVRMVTNGQAMNSISSSVTFILNLVAVISLVKLSDQAVTTGTLMALLWIIGVFLTRPFRQMPWFFMFMFDSWTSLKRVDSFLNLKNFEAHVRPDEFIKVKPLDRVGSALTVKNLNLSIGGTSLLKGIDLDVKTGEFITIVGEVGSGKSLLLLSLLGETGASFSRYQVGENNTLEMPLDQVRQFFTYVPQEGFIMSATLRENVAFEYGVSSQKVDEGVLASLERSQFKMNLERVEHGLDTEIGERGVNLSGGQKQRVSLARVDYYQAPIILLDDCLSAVDVDTENKLLDALIKGSWQERTRLLVTHRLTVLEKSDRVLFIKDGSILAQGTFHDLLATNAEFRHFASTVAFDESKKATAAQMATLEQPKPSEGNTPSLTSNLTATLPKDGES